MSGTDEAARFRAAARQERLLVQRCASCGRASLPPAPSCLHCGSPDVATVDGATTGSLLTWTVTHVAFDPAFADEVPYAVGIVELDDGARIAGTINVAAARLASELRLQLTWRASPADGGPVWTFVEELA
jgi:uncharacterized OB-fold protein